MQIVVSLDIEAQRPIAQIDWFKGCRALLDTGSVFPIWNDDGSKLEKAFGAKLERKNITFGGFGGKAKGDLYRVNFRLDKLYYIDMPIIASAIPGENWHMIISANMLGGMIYEIDTINKRLSIDTRDNQPVRILRLSNDSNRLSTYLAGTYMTESDYYKTKPSIQDLSASDLYSRLRRDT